MAKKTQKNSKTKKKNIKTSNKKKSFIPKDKTNLILLIIFLILCVVVFVLATIMITQNAEHRNDKYDIEVPLTQESLSDGVDIRINMDDVERNQSKEYRIRLTNYIDDQINESVLNYRIRVQTPEKNSDIDIELYSSEANYELLDGKKRIGNLRLGNEEKEEVTYTLKLTQRNNKSSNEYVNVRITEDNK